MEQVNVQEQEWFFTNARQQQLFGRAVLPAPGTPVVAALVFNHGYAEHSGRKLEAFKQLAARGIAVYALDMASFGRSEPTAPSQRALIWRWQHLVDDLCWFAEEARSRHSAQGLPPVPWFLAGFSLGGLTAAHAVLRQQDLWAGLVLVSGCMWVFMTLFTQLQRVLAPLLLRIAPTAQIVQRLDPAHDLNPDPEAVQSYVSDPLVYRSNTRVTTAYQMGMSIFTMKAVRKAVDVPVYALHATRDAITPYRDMKEFVGAINSADKTLVTVQGGFHDLLGGQDTAQHVRGIADWILSRAQPQPCESRTC